jgi:CubicO group peptidase (beta-lactamase class C family)
MAPRRIVCVLQVLALGLLLGACDPEPTALIDPGARTPDLGTDAPDHATPHDLGSDVQDGAEPSDMVDMALDLADVQSDAAPDLGAIVSLDELLTETLDTHPLPSLVAWVFDAETTIAAGVSGVRKTGDPTPARKDDLYHLGSCTKAMTATLAARLVERGLVAWSDTAADVLSLTRVHPDLAQVGLIELLSNTGGMPASLSQDWPDLWRFLWQNQEDPRAARRELAAQLFAVSPEQAVGSYAYSNAGFIIAGAMLEAAADAPWESLMRDEVFGPLAMDSCGFGPQASPDAVDQPWPHEWTDDGPRTATGSWDNPTGLGPAGTVHCNLEDWAAFGRLHLGDGGDYLSADSMAELHTVRATEKRYALGWAAVERPWAGGTALTHSGSNTMNYAIIWLAPAKGKGILIATNIAGDPVFSILDGVIGTLIQTFL